VVGRIESEFVAAKPGPPSMKTIAPRDGLERSFRGRIAKPIFCLPSAGLPLTAGTKIRPHRNGRSAPMSQRRSLGREEMVACLGAFEAADPDAVNPAVVDRGPEAPNAGAAEGPDAAPAAEAPRPTAKHIPKSPAAIASTSNRKRRLNFGGAPLSGASRTDIFCAPSKSMRPARPILRAYPARRKPFGALGIGH
jgi:hypothetical protein